MHALAYSACFYDQFLWSFAKFKLYGYKNNEMALLKKGLKFFTFIQFNVPWIFAIFEITFMRREFLNTPFLSSPRCVRGSPTTKDAAFTYLPRGPL